MTDYRVKYAGCSLSRRGALSEAWRSQYFGFEKGGGYGVILASEAETSTTPSPHFSALKRLSLFDFSYVTDSQNHKVDDERGRESCYTHVRARLRSVLI
jgi:hypothetical protein